MLDYLDMGKYTVFVWPSFAIAVAVLAVLYVWSRRSLKANQQQLESLRQARRATRAKAGQGNSTGVTTDDDA